MTSAPEKKEKKKDAIEIKHYKFVLGFLIQTGDTFNRKIKYISLGMQCDLHIFFRNSHPEGFCKKGVLRNFAKFSGKHLWPATLLKKRPCHRCFPVNFAKFLRTHFPKEYGWWQLQFLYLPLNIFAQSQLGNSNEIHANKNMKNNNSKSKQF